MTKQHGTSWPPCNWPPASFGLIDDRPYIDYTLAQCCALQFWARSRTDFPGALDAYVRLCGRGGEAPFQDLVRSAGLVSPFAPGALEAVVTEAQAFLDA